MTKRWIEVRDKRALRDVNSQLQQFCCTDDLPRTPSGRRTLPHPRPWEWQAQRHVRNLVHQFKPGDLVLLRMEDESELGALTGAVHLHFSSDSSRLVAAVEVIAVEVTHRGSQPPHIADELLEWVKGHLQEQVPTGIEDVLLAALIHVKNEASMKWAARHGFEAVQGVDEAVNGYIRWACLLQR